ncbi:MAG: Clp1/GlmU family protein [Candidatus Bathyarchaeia archaeon]
MKYRVEKGKTLLVDGPASVSLLSGRAKVLGATLKTGEKVVVREGKRMPFEVNKRVVFDLMLGEGATFEETEGSTIPTSWENASMEIISYGKPVTVMVMGGVDSGKTSFCTYLANKALKRKRKIAIIDGDLGQSDIGPPSTIGFSLVTTPIKDLFEMEAENAYFVGLTSPSRAVNRVIEGLNTLKGRVLETGINFLIVNTDGWIEGEDAARYKVRLTEKVAPDIVVGIQQEDELTPILTALKGAKTLVIDSPPVIHKRSREKRKVLRELSYKKYLKEARVQSFPLNWVSVEGAPFGTGVPLTLDQMEKVRKALGVSLVYGEETPTTVFVVLKGDQWVDEELVQRIEEGFRKRVKAIREGEEQGLLLALLDAPGNFLGIGVLCGVDYKRRVMKVYTPVSENVSTIHVGQMKLDKRGGEIGLNPLFMDYEP